MSGLRFAATHFAAVATAAVFSSLSCQAQCELTWRPTLAVAGTNNRVTDIVDVPGDGLYASGWFRVAGGVRADYVAHFDGSDWNAMDGGLDGAAQTIAALPNGDIVVAGTFTMAGGVAASNIARWDGSSWHPLGAGLNAIVQGLHAMPNGDLLACGSFTATGTQPLSRLARWDGTSWSNVGGGVGNGQVFDVVSLPNGDIAVGGTFSQVGGSAGGTVATGLGIWDGISWTTPPGALAFGAVHALEALSNGNLAVGGQVVAGENLGIWDGQAMQYLSNPIGGVVEEILEDSSGDLIVAGGSFLSGPDNNVVRVQNGVWTVLDSGLNKTLSLAESGGQLIAAGGAINSGDDTIRAYDGSVWAPLGAPRNPKPILDVCATSSGGVFACGGFDEIGGVPANNVAHYDGANWTALGLGLNGPCSAMAAYPNGDLLVSGSFTTAGGAPANKIARWNGSNWSTLGAGLTESPSKLLAMSNGDVIAVMATRPSLLLFDGTNWTALPQPNFQTWGPALAAELPNGNLVVAGIITDTPAAEWDGSVWTPIGAGAGIARSLAVDNNGDLLLGGFLAVAGVVNGVSRWNGSNWVEVGALSGSPVDLEVLPNGDLVACGFLQLDPSQEDVLITRWNGQSWQKVDGGVGFGLGSFKEIQQLAVSHEGDVFATGNFATMGDAVCARFAQAKSTCPAEANVFGAGCNGSAGPVALTATDLPWIGSTFHSEATGMAPISIALHVLGSNPTIAPLPGGAPGCSLFLQPDVLGLLLPNAGVVDATVAVPANTALVGAVVRTQVVGIELSVSGSLTRLTSSNALELTIGAL